MISLRKFAPSAVFPFLVPSFLVWILFFFFLSYLLGMLGVSVYVSVFVLYTHSIIYILCKQNPSMNCRVSCFNMIIRMLSSSALLLLIFLLFELMSTLQTRGEKVGGGNEQKVHFNLRLTQWKCSLYLSFATAFGMLYWICPREWNWIEKRCVGSAAQIDVNAFDVLRVTRKWFKFVYQNEPS